MSFPQKKISVDEAIIKARTFCNYRDRCHKEVKDKLYGLGLWKNEVDQVMMQMMDENKGSKTIDLDNLADDESSEYCVKCKKYTALSDSIKSMIDNL